MKKKEAEQAIRQLSIVEKMAKLSEAAMSQVEDHIEKALSEELEQNAKANAANPEH